MAAAHKFQWSVEADAYLLQQIRVLLLLSPAAVAGQGNGPTSTAAANHTNSNQSTKTSSGQTAAKQLEQIDWGRIAKALSKCLASQNQSAPRIEAAECEARIQTLLNRIQKHRTIHELVYLAESSALKKLCSTGNAQRNFDAHEVPYLWYYEDAAAQDFVERHVTRKQQNEKSAVSRSNLAQHYNAKWLEHNPIEKLKKISKFCKKHNIKFGPNLVRINKSLLVVNNGNKTSNIETESNMVNHAQQNHRISTNNTSSSAIHKASILNEDLFASSKPASKKKAPKLLPNEPKKPANNSYSLFTKNTLISMRNDDSMNGKEKLVKVGQLWKECDQKEKKALEDEISKQQDQYLKELSEFGRTITDEQDLEDFKQRHRAKLGKTLFL